MRQRLITIMIAGILLLTACNAPNADATPTVDVNQIQTNVVETYAVIQTQTALAQPTVELFPTLTPSPTVAPLVTLASTLPTIPQVTAGATKSCYSLAFVSDVTIPDNTPVKPGQTFTKTWKVVNNGSCAWDAGFKFAFVSGDAMSGATYTLPSAVPVNGIVEISVSMTAPTNKTGAVRGDWRMSTASGQFFGDQIYVIVVVGGSYP
ncbi:MAG TPA: NBR1-Ig-like domain-containing protein [Anaerolineales bacterium]|nr:NBR1-Ig-like domain-containing protein [Anaerolineales bacterium]